MAAANAPRNDDAHEPVDADSDEELLEVADVARSPSFPNFIGGHPNVVTTVARSRGAGQGGRGEDSRGGGSVNPVPGVSTVEGGRGDGQGGGSVSQAPRRGTVPRRSPSSFASSKGGERKVKKLHQS